MLAWAIACGWWWRLMDGLVGLRRVPNLTDAEYDRSPAGDPLLVVIVPARNEEGKIGPCLRSLAGQDYGNVRVLAVDDRSVDATGAEMEAIAAQHRGRVEVLHVRELPPGWLGKTHAMARAAERVLDMGAAVLLFTDGDVVFTPEILRRSLAAMQEMEADHFVTLPTTVTRSAGESMMLTCLHVLGLLAVRPWRVPRAGTKDAVGVGAFNMISREAYVRTGGFAGMPMEVVEDLTLGRRVKLLGMRQCVAYAPGAVTVHWAAGLWGVLHGMTKNMFAVFEFRPERLLAGAMGLAVFLVGPFVLLAVPGARLPALFAVTGIAGMYWLVGRRSLLSPGWVAGAPVAGVLLMYSMLRSMVVTLRAGGVTWRGTFYPLAELRSAARERSRG